MADKKRTKRIGITMRVEEVAKSGEQRDCLAQEWQDFLRFALPEAHCILIPNLGTAAEVKAFLGYWGVQGVILSGGNNIGAVPRRDNAEKAVLSYCIARALPVFGVCRGLQMIQSYFGGRLQECVRRLHVGNKHVVLFRRDEAVKYNMDVKCTVNSYHVYGVKEKSLSRKLIPFALTADGWVEGVIARDYPITAVLWHPERGRPFRRYDRAIIRSALGFR